MAKWHKITHLPVRSVSNIFGRMVYTMKPSKGLDTIKASVKRLSGKEFTTADKEGLMVESSKVVSYLLMYPHISVVRCTCLSILANIGFVGDSRTKESYWMTRLRGEMGGILDDPDMCGRPPTTPGTAVSSKGW